MKKVASIALIALFAIGFTSCKKDYACECKTTSGGNTVTATGATAKMSKKDAEATCNKLDVTSGTTTVECTAVAK